VKVPPPGQLGPLRDESRANIQREVDASLREHRRQHKRPFYLSG
jgi:hypothetical protein